MAVHQLLHDLTVDPSRTLLRHNDDIVVVQYAVWDPDLEVVCTQHDGLADATKVGAQGRVKRLHGTQRYRDERHRPNAGRERA